MKQQFEITAYIQAQRTYDGQVSLKALTVNMSEYGYTPVLEQTVTFEADIPDDFDIVSAEIDQLQKTKKKIQADAQLQVTQIEERIQSLQCLEYKE